MDEKKIEEKAREWVLRAGLNWHDVKGWLDELGTECFKAGFRAGLAEGEASRRETPMEETNANQ